MKLYNGDCIEVMKSLDDNSIDCVITDPPYGLDKKEKHILEQSITQIKRISKMQIFILDWRYPLTLDDNKFAELIWEYGWISGGRTKSNHFYPTHNTIHFCGENRFNFNTKEGSIIKRKPGFSSPRQCSFAKKTGHPYEKPVKLIEYLIEKVRGDKILDPFMGSGTTGVACKKLNRDFIGIELDEEYFKIAEQRINNIKKNKD